MAYEQVPLDTLTNNRWTSSPISDPTKKKAKEPTPETESKAVEEMEKHWELPDDLRGGTLKMRKKAQKWLPREPAESPAAYDRRLASTILYGVYDRTVKTLAGLPFMRAATVDKVPAELDYIKMDCDNNGTSLTEFAHSLLDDQINRGIAYFLVDMPEFSDAETLQDQQDYKIRPYFVQICPKQIKGWTTERIGGMDILTSIRIEEEFTEPDGLFGEKEVEQVRMITRDFIYLYREDEEKEEWYLYDALPNNLGKIPLVTVYGNKKGFMKALPPLEGLAWLNLRHYQKLSDLDNIEHVANVPLLYGKGFPEGSTDGLEIGPNRFITGPENSDIKYVEHSGAAISASQKSIEMLEDRMAAMGADLIIRKSVDRQTATARLLDSSESISMLQLMVNNLEEALEEGIRIAAEWLDTTAPDVEVEIGDNLRTGKEGPNLLDMLAQYIIQNGGMSIDQAEFELKRRGVFADNYKAKEVEVVTQEGVMPQQPVVTEE